MEDILFYLVVGIIVTLPVTLVINLIFKKWRSHWSKSERRFVAVIIGIVLTPVICIGGIYGFFYLEDYYPKREFSHVSWIDNPNERFEMVDDLVNDKTLIGMNTEQVEILLGEPSWKSDSIISYYTGTRSAGFGLAFCSLNISLNNNLVIEAVKVEHLD